MCGAVHDERTRRRMLRGDRWVAQLEALDEDVISFGLGRLDSARASLAQICREWRRAKRAYLDSMPVRLDGHLKDACRGAELFGAADYPAVARDPSSAGGPRHQPTPLPIDRPARPDEREQG